MRDPRVVKDLALQCRPLIIVLLVSYSFLIIAFSTAMAAAPHLSVLPINEGDSEDPYDIYKAHLETSRAYYSVLASFTLIATILSALHLTATYVMKVWLALPYFFFHVCLLISMVVLFVLYFHSVLSISHYDRKKDMFTKFTLHLLYHQGGYPFFCGSLAIGFYVYGALIMWNFVWQLWQYLRERKAESSVRIKPSKEKGRGDRGKDKNNEADQGTDSYRAERRVSLFFTTPDASDQEPELGSRRGSRLVPVDNLILPVESSRFGGRDRDGDRKKKDRSRSRRKSAV